MPADDGRHGRRSRRAFTKTISTAAAALSALALAACTSSAGTSSPSATASAAAATGGTAVTLTGGFPSPTTGRFFDVAFPKYQQQNPAVTVSYSSVGSSAGIAAFTAKKVNFGASDVPMTAPSRPPPGEVRWSRCPSTSAAKPWYTTSLACPVCT